MARDRLPLLPLLILSASASMASGIKVSTGTLRRAAHSKRTSRTPSGILAKSKVTGMGPIVMALNLLIVQTLKSKEFFSVSLSICQNADIMDKEELRSLLKTSGKTREWLAREIGVSKSNVDGMLSNRRITERTEIAIRRAFANSDAAPEQVSSEMPVTVNFNLTQVGKIHRAMKRRKYDDIQAFFEDAVIEFADQINTETRKGSAPSNIRDLTQFPVMDKVAEDPKLPGQDNGEKSA